jgi:hypothetical protein
MAIAEKVNFNLCCPGTAWMVRIGRAGHKKKEISSDTAAVKVKNGRIRIKQ